MSKKDDKIGERFNRLTILEVIREKDKSAVAKCLCDCGNIKLINFRAVKTGNTKSCGCLLAEINADPTRNPAYKHGDRRRDSEYYQLHSIWSDMLKRCRPSKKNPNSQQQQDYYLRGIRVCKEWEDYANFKDWAVNHSNYKLNSGLSIERIDVNSNYCPENCTWIPKNEQSKNRRFCHFITYNGETHTLTDWAKILGMPRTTLCARLNDYGWSVEKAFTTPRLINQFK